MFLLVSGIPSLVVAPPKYDVLYVTGYYNNMSGVQVSVVDQKVQVYYQGNIAGLQKPRIWRYSPRTGAVREITYMLPPGLYPPGQALPAPVEAAKITPIEVPDLAGLKVDSSSVAPDGYRFTSGKIGYSGDVFTGLFYGAQYSREAVLTRQGRNFRLPDSDNSYLSNQLRFIGWVVSP